MRPRLLGDRYRLGPVIGVGGMGAVHRAHVELLGRDVAVKVLRAGAAAADCERLRREVEYLRAVQHPNLVAVLDGGADGSDEAGGEYAGVAWFAMELVAGPDLRTLLDERGPLEGAAVRRVLTGVLGALGAMHAAGLVHRDVTPSNILLTADPFARWEAKLADLGIARRVRSVPMTGAGLVVGTAAYLSPEQVTGGEIGPAADVYAIALVALEALTGVTPFPGSAIESATSRLLRTPDLPTDLAPEWRDLLLLATSRDPADRPHVAAFQAAARVLPEDAGVRPDPRSRDVTSATAAAQRSTAVLPAASQATGVMRAARTSELASEPRRRSGSRVVTVLVASAAIVAGIAVIGSAALAGSQILMGAAAAGDAAASSPQASPSASVTAQVNEAMQGARTSAEQARSDDAAQPEAVAGQAGVDPGGRAAEAAVPGTGPAAPGGPAQRPDGPAAAPADPTPVDVQ